MIKKFLFSMRTKLYFIPGLYALFFIVMACAFIYLDYFAGLAVTSSTPMFFYTSRSLGGTILSTVVGSLLTMLTITFSIMMVVLTIYSSQLSPRTLQDFLEKKTTMRILGFFIGALIFSIISLFAVKSERLNTYVLSPAASILLLILAVILFAYFIHYIAKSVQVSLYIQNLVKETAVRIENYLKEIDDNPDIISGSLTEYSSILESKAREVAANQSGFIQYYDEKRLFSFALEHNVVLSCVNSVGQHVLAGDPLLQIYHYNQMTLTEKTATPEELEELLLGFVYIGDETNLYEDVGAGTKKLVEIAVRALSPGINDPYTAVFCVEQLGFLLQKAAKGLEAKVYMDSEQNVRLIVQGITFDRVLFQHFNQIAHYGLKDITIIDAILGALIMICKNNGSFIKDQVWRYSGYLTKKLNLTEYPEYEKKYIRERYYQLSKASGQQISLNELLTAV